MNNIADPVLFQGSYRHHPLKFLINLARLDKTQLHALLKGLSFQSSAGGFQPLISSDRHQITTKQRDTVQNTRDLYAGNPECGVNVQALLREIIYASQEFDPMSNGQRVHNEIHRLGLIRCIRTEKRKPLGHQPFTASSAFYVQSINMVNAVYILVIEGKAFPKQLLPNARVTKTSAFKHQLSDKLC